VLSTLESNSNRTFLKLKFGFSVTGSGSLCGSSCAMTGSSATSTGSSRMGVCSIWLLGLTTIFLDLQADRFKTNRTQLVAKRLFIIRFIVCFLINVYTPKVLYILLFSLAKRMILAVRHSLGRVVKKKSSITANLTDTICLCVLNSIHLTERSKSVIFEC